MEESDLKQLKEQLTSLKLPEVEPSTFGNFTDAFYKEDKVTKMAYSIQKFDCDPNTGTFIINFIKNAPQLLEDFIKLKQEYELLKRDKAKLDVDYSSLIADYETALFNNNTGQ